MLHTCYIPVQYIRVCNFEREIRSRHPLNTQALALCYEGSEPHFKETRSGNYVSVNRAVEPSRSEGDEDSMLPAVHFILVHKQGALPG